MSETNENNLNASLEATLLSVVARHLDFVLQENADVCLAIEGITQFAQKKTNVHLHISDILKIVLKLVPALALIARRSYGEAILDQNPTHLLAGALQTLRVEMEMLCFLLFSSSVIVDVNMADLPFPKEYAGHQQQTTIVTEQFLKLLFQKEEYADAVKRIQKAAESTRSSVIEEPKDEKKEQKEEQKDLA